MISSLTSAILMSSASYATTFYNETSQSLTMQSAISSASLALASTQSATASGAKWGNDHNIFVTFSNSSVCKNLIDKGLVKWGTRYPADYDITINKDFSCKIGKPDHPIPPAKPFTATIQAKSSSTELTGQGIIAELQQTKKSLSEYLKINAPAFKLTDLKGNYKVSAPSISYDNHTYIPSYSTPVINSLHTFEVITYKLEQPTPGKLVYPHDANGAWIYDNNNYPLKPDSQDLGSQVNKIMTLNESLSKNSGLNEIFPYAGDIELTDSKNTSGDGWNPCNDKTNLKYCDIHVNYDSKKAYNGKLTVASYAKKLQGSQVKHIVPVIDGRTDDMGVSHSYDQIFNKMPQSFANNIANEVAKQICADPNVDGVQFDIEPFQIPAKATPGKDGQYYFYKKIAQDFASKQFNCVDESHPKGRFFSVFTFAKSINPRLAKVFNQYHNGYIVDSLYDLGPKNAERAGKASTLPSLYSQYVTKEMNDLIANAKTYKVHFQIGIPAVASVHEFSAYANNTPNSQKFYYPPHELDRLTGVQVTQVEYLQALKNADNYKTLLKSPYYVGTDVWAIDGVMPWKPYVNGSQITRYYFPAQIQTNEYGVLNTLLSFKSANDQSIDLKK